MKNVWKQGLLLALIAAMVMSLVACGSPAAKEQEEDPVVEKEVVKEESKAEETAEEKEAAKETEKPTEKPTEAPKKTEKPKETKAPQPTPAPTPQPTVAPAEEAPAPVASADTARQYIGGSASSLAAAIGQPNGKSYASSCIGEGQDGEWYYNGFTVYTYRAPDGSERVEDVM